jgi:uncharacterized protein (DUF433 family)
MTETTPSHPVIVRNSRGLSLAGTRITLYSIMDYVKAGWPPALIRDWLSLSDTQINAVMDYIETHRPEVEAEYQTVLREADEIRKYWEERNREHFAKVAAVPPGPGNEKIRAKLQVRKAKWKAAR